MKERFGKLIPLLLIVLGFVFYNSRHPGQQPEPNRTILQAYEQQLSNIVVTGKGKIVRLLPDDLHGSRHQRFIVTLNESITVLIAHNIDLAPRIDSLAVGDNIDFKGEYEWNNKGGVVHWTHRDPRGRHPHGWIRHQNQIYE